MTNPVAARLMSLIQSTDHEYARTQKCFLVHPQAINESQQVGVGTRIWAFAHVLPGAKIGVDCNICEHVFIENQVVIGNRVTVKLGAQIYDGVTLEDDTFIGPKVVFTNDKFPRSKQHKSSYPPTIVRRGASIGANATILPGLTIGQNSMVGAGSVVTRDVPPHAVVCGNPAVIKSYAQVENKGKKALDLSAAVSSPELVRQPNIQGVTLIPLPKLSDLRGSLTHAEIGRGLPFFAEALFLSSLTCLTPKFAVDMRIVNCISLSWPCAGKSMSRRMTGSNDGKPCLTRPSWGSW